VEGGKGQTHASKKSGYGFDESTKVVHERSYIQFASELAYTLDNNANR